MIVCLTPPQMNDFGDLLGTPYAPVSKIATVKNTVLRPNRQYKARTAEMALVRYS